MQGHVQDSSASKYVMSWRHVEFPNFDLTSSSFPWELKQLEGRGYCAFALKDFKAGDLILTESPTVWAPGHHPFNEEQIRVIEDRVKALSEDDQQAFYAMANVYPELPSRCAGIFMTNSFDMVDSPHGDACAMYCAIARLNHSCTPNVQQTHCPETGKEYLYACRDIVIGEEICDCYIDLRQTREARQRELLDNYRFVCRCPACTCTCRCPYSDDDDDDEEEEEEEVHTAEDVHSFRGQYGEVILRKCPDGDNDKGDVTVTDDAARVLAGEFEDRSIDAVADGDLDRGLAIALDGLALLENPINLKWSVRYIAAAHLLVYQIADEMGVAALARKHIQLAHKYNLMLQGPNTPDSKRTAQLLAKIVA
jgi:SET domain